MLPKIYCCSNNCEIKCRKSNPLGLLEKLFILVSFIFTEKQVEKISNNSYVYMYLKSSQGFSC